MITEEEYLKEKQIVQEYEKQLNISDVIERYEKIKNEYSECMSNYIKTGSRIYLDRAKEIEIIFDFFNG